MADTQREQLIKILKQDRCPSPYICDENCQYTDLESCHEARIADALLASGIIVPPCKVGDTVYEIDDYVYYDKCKDCEYYYGGGMGDLPECEKTISGRQPAECAEIKEITVKFEDICAWIYFNSFGKTVFSSKEEATNSLKSSYKNTIKDRFKNIEE